MIVLMFTLYYIATCFRTYNSAKYCLLFPSKHRMFVVINFPDSQCQSRILKAASRLGWTPDRLCHSNLHVRFLRAEKGLIRVGFKIETPEFQIF